MVNQVLGLGVAFGMTNVRHFKSCCWILDCSQLFISGGAWLAFTRLGSNLHSGVVAPWSSVAVGLYCLEFGPACNQCRCAVCRTLILACNDHASYSDWVAVALLSVCSPTRQRRWRCRDITQAKGPFSVTVFLRSRSDLVAGLLMSAFLFNLALTETWSSTPMSG
jgi:hypothetical protein